VTTAGVPAGTPTDLDGDVFEAYPEGVGKAIPAARVAALVGGKPVETDADEHGHFKLQGIPSGSALVVTAPGYVPSVLSGWDGASLEVHLAVGSPLTPRFEQYLPVQGDVTMGDDVAAGAIVIGGNNRGTSFGPFIADERGHFSGLAVSYEGTAATDLATFALLEPGSAEPSALGLALGGAIGEDAAAIQVELQRPQGQVHFDPSGPAGSRLAKIVGHAPNGLEVAVSSWSDTQDLGHAPYFEITGGALLARVEVECPDRQAHTVWRQKVQQPGLIKADLLDFPAAPSVRLANVAEGASLTWPAVAQADAYRVVLRQHGATLPLWEGYTRTASIGFRGLPTELPDELEIIAMLGDGANLRQLASLGGPRFLRWFDAGTQDRFASRIIPLLP
jgi:hypothetical protein